jgi:peptidoglycan/xylan/chitin deacetylase (PgdA/CDA1 family)/tetratricopeptide (TPR) repeat protein
VAPFLAGAALWLCAACAQAADPLAPAQVRSLATETVARFRQAIILAESDHLLRPDEQERAAVVGRYLFSRSHEAQAGWLRAVEEAPSAAARIQAVERLLESIEQEADFRDADRLAFQELLGDLDAIVSGLPAGAASERLASRLAEDRKAVAEILQRYEREIGNVLERFGQRAMQLRRESWDSYLAGLRARYDARSILEAHEALTRGLPVSRGPGRRKPDPATEISWAELPPRTVVLTFDDGPHARHTDRIREILIQHDVPAVFFHVGQNLGQISNDAVKLGRASQAAKRLSDAGMALGNHSFTHPVLTELDDAGRTLEIGSTNRLLEGLGIRPPRLFRPPYGAFNPEVARAAQSAGLKTLMWNIDSKDWADPVPASIVRRVLSLTDEQGRGVILFHDIQHKTVEALPYVLEGLKEAGYRFAAWNGSAFVAGDAPANAADTRSIYRRSWAVVIGIDEYAKWPWLRYAVNDARGVRESLIARYGFAPENVVTLLNGEATRDRIMAVLADQLTDLDKIKREDRVLVFFAGHGATRALASGRDMGYIVPADADPARASQLISMANLQEIADAIPAKHVLFVMDSCYSGLGLTRAAPNSGKQYLTQVARRNARQMFTAGGADEQVADSGPNGHSIFTWTLLQALQGEGDLNRDGLITASELAAYASPIVSTLSRQTPAFGSLPGSEGGEFVFQLQHETEYLSEVSSQLDEDAIRLNEQIAQARAQIAAKAERNRELKKQLADAQRELNTQPASAAGPESASRMNDEGMAHYKQKRYDQALAAFTEAARLDPTHAQAVNNAGFVLYRMNRNAEAVLWLEKAVALDPKRAVAHLNLGDAYARIGKRDLARAAYEKYLALSPAAKASAEVRSKLEALR